MNKVKLSLLALFCWVVSVGASAAERLPVSAFASLPEISMMRLSPDGKKVASLVNQAANTLLIAQDVDGKNASVLFTVDNNGRSINWFAWKNNDRLLVSVRMASSRGGVTTIETRLISVRSNGDDLRNLVKFNPDGLHQFHDSQFQDKVVDWLPDDPDHILLALDILKPLAPDVYKVDINTGSRDKIQNGREYVFDWITDRQHRVRAAVKTNYRFKNGSDSDYEVLFTLPDENEWKTAWKYAALSEEEIEPLGFANDPNILYVSAYKDGYRGVFTVDLRDPMLKLVVKDWAMGRDIDGRLWYSQKNHEVIGLINENERGDYRLWDESLLSLEGGIDKAMPDSINSFVSFSEDETRYLLYAASSNYPGTYYLGDRKTKRLEPIGSTYSKLTTEILAGKRMVKYQARDGVEIQAYLTVPKGVDAKKLPTIIFPHGGPIYKDDADFDYWTEFFANRGYAVLQMDFRGSAGYGYDFMAAGFKQWGLHMQDDIVDGTRWLIDSGIADKNRVCIAGASFGGYAALMGAVKNSDMYRCAISFAGVTDLQDLIINKRDYVNGDVAEKQIGQAWGDRVQLQSNSPRYQADKVRIPVLLVHGSKDRAVPIQQGRDMADALQGAGKPFKFIELEDGDHWLSSYQHRIKLFEAMDEFLATHLGTGSTASASNTQANR
jgi:dipeptidyl aminopeptidase/acylaminoacyl peptidase